MKGKRHTTAERIRIPAQGRRRKDHPWRLQWARHLPIFVRASGNLAAGCITKLCCEQTFHRWKRASSEAR